MVQLARQQNNYDLLDLDSKADMDTVRKRYYQLARKYHPDALEGVLARVCRFEGEEYFAAVTDAYNTLTHPEQRKEYDQMLSSQTGRDRERSDQNPAELAKLNFTSGKRALAAGELHDATQFFRNAVQLDPSQGEYHRELGIVEMRNPRWQKSAEESLRRAIQLEQTDARALAHLGQIYQGNGLKRRAIETYQTALEWDPENDMARAGLAALEAATGSGRKSFFKRR
jgi:DnaJ-class molecular chaperone